MTGVTAMMAAGAHSSRRKIGGITVTLSANTTNYSFTPNQIPGYITGSTDVTLVINSGVYVYSTSTATPALTVTSFASGDTVSIINNGYIIGMGGKGGGNRGDGTGIGGEAGGPAVSLSYPVSITNNSYIAGGGGGGALGEHLSNAWMSGGGGAGGGRGGDVTGYEPSGTGGEPGSTGGDGVSWEHFAGYYWYSGGGGGRILPGVGGAGGTGNSYTTQFGRGGGSGGGAPGWYNTNGKAGGSANNPGQNGGYILAGGTYWINFPGGGGGWGAAGGSGSYAYANNGAGGKAVNLNGNTVTWLATGTRYGAIS